MVIVFCVVCILVIYYTNKIKFKPTLGKLSVVVVIFIENRSIRFHKNVEFQLIEM